MWWIWSWRWGTVFGTEPVVIHDDRWETRQRDLGALALKVGHQASFKRRRILRKIIRGHIDGEVLAPVRHQNKCRHYHRHKKRQHQKCHIAPVALDALLWVYTLRVSLDALAAERGVRVPVLCTQHIRILDIVALRELTAVIWSTNVRDNGLVFEAHPVIPRHHDLPALTVDPFPANVDIYSKKAENSQNALFFASDLTQICVSVAGQAASLEIVPDVIVKGIAHSANIPIFVGSETNRTARDFKCELVLSHNEPIIIRRKVHRIICADIVTVQPTNRWIALRRSFDSVHLHRSTTNWQTSRTTKWLWCWSPSHRQSHFLSDRRPNM